MKIITIKLWAIIFQFILLISALFNLEQWLATIGIFELLFISLMLSEVKEQVK